MSIYNDWFRCDGGCDTDGLNNRVAIGGKVDSLNLDTLAQIENSIARKRNDKTSTSGALVQPERKYYFIYWKSEDITAQ